jgi:Putative esterase
MKFHPQPALGRRHVARAGEIRDALDRPHDERPDQTTPAVARRLRHDDGARAGRRHRHRAREAAAHHDQQLDRVRHLCLAIVVAPQGARADGDDREYLDWGPTENWPQAIASDLPRCIDKRFRTIHRRSGRALIGLSAGGFGAFNIGLRRLSTYAAVESWSGYFEATDPTGLRKLDLGSPEANRKARVPRGHHLKAKLTKRATFIGFYVGRQDSRFLNANNLLDQAFSQHHITHLFRVYEGGHQGSLWTRWAPMWLGLALDHMSRSQVLPPS